MKNLQKTFSMYYKVNGKKFLIRAERGIARLKSFFEGMRSADITTGKIKAYMLTRKEEGVGGNATINR